MGIGLALPNHELISQIRSRHPKGIYSTRVFKRKMKPGKIFFCVNDGEGGVGTIDGPHTFKRFKNPIGRPSKKEKQRLFETEEKHYMRGRIEDYVSDLFNGAKACFEEKKHAEAYHSELLNFEERKLLRQAY